MGEHIVWGWETSARSPEYTVLSLLRSLNGPLCLWGLWPLPLLLAKPVSALTEDTPGPGLGVLQWPWEVGDPQIRTRRHGEADSMGS